MSLRAIFEYIKDAIDLIVCIDRLADGKRKITKICEIDGIINDKLKLNDIFIFEQRGITKNQEVDGIYALIERQPKVYLKIKRNGINLVDNMLGHLPSETRSTYGVSNSGIMPNIRK